LGGLLTDPQPLSASVHSLLEAPLFCLTEDHFPPFQAFLSPITPDDFFNHNKGNANSLVRRDSVSPFLGQFISFFIPRYSMMPFCPSTVTLIDPLSFYDAAILSHTKDNSVVDFASAAIAVLLWEQICILLLITYFDKSISVILRIAITSA